MSNYLMGLNFAISPIFAFFAKINPIKVFTLKLAGSLLIGVGHQQKKLCSYAYILRRFPEDIFARYYCFVISPLLTAEHDNIGEFFFVF